MATNEYSDRDVELRAIAERIVGFSNVDLDKLLRYVEIAQAKNDQEEENKRRKELQEFGTNDIGKINTSNGEYGIHIDFTRYIYEELKKKFSQNKSSKQLLDQGRLAKDVYRLLDKVSDGKTFSEAQKITYESFATKHPVTYPIGDNEITKKLSNCNIDHNKLFSLKDDNNLVRLWVTAGHSTNIAFIVKIDYTNRLQKGKFKAGLFAVDTNKISGYLYTSYPVLFFKKDY